MNKQRKLPKDRDPDVTHTIYGLVDPRCRLLYYIGTTIDLRKRITYHLGGQGNNAPLQEWMIELRKLGLKPIIRIFGTAPNREEAAAKEALLIQEMYVNGHPLKNRESIFRRGDKLTQKIQQALSIQ